MAKRFLYSKVDGQVIDFEEDIPTMTERMIGHVSRGEWLWMEAPLEQEMNLRKQRCQIIDGTINLKPITDWPEKTLAEADIEAGLINNEVL